MTDMTTTTNITSDITDALADYGDSWAKPWNMPNVTNLRTDAYGNTVHIHDQGETVRIEFEYALGGVVETMDLNPAHGGRRIAAVIDALAAAPVE